MSKCCGCNKRIVSNAVANCMKGEACTDVCVNPQCGEPKHLTVMTPVVYDEIGINICRTIPLDALVADYPTAVFASAEVIDVTGEAITITPILSRPNCYEVTLTNLSVTFALRLYDCCKRLLATINLPGILYLPPSTADPYYDEDTNPSTVSLELFAPYGVVYTNGDVNTPELNFIGFSSANSTLNQGLNMMAIPKVLNFDMTERTVTIGLTLIVNSVYFTLYQLPHNGRTVVSKGTLTSTEESVCMDFVMGSLLDRNIKPLEFCNPGDNKDSCNTCDDTDDCFCLMPAE